MPSLLSEVEDIRLPFGSEYIKKALILLAVSCDEMIQSLIGYDCFIHAGSLIKQSILFSGCDIGAKSQLNRVILDKNCTIAPGTIIGENREQDEERFLGQDGAEASEDGRDEAPSPLRTARLIFMLAALATRPCPVTSPEESRRRRSTRNRAVW